MICPSHDVCESPRTLQNKAVPSARLDKSAQVEARACPLNSQPAESAGKCDEGGVVAERLLVARRDAAGLLEQVERALDGGPLLVEVPIVGQRGDAVGV